MLSSVTIIYKMLKISELTTFVDKSGIDALSMPFSI